MKNKFIKIINLALAFVLIFGYIPTSMATKSDLEISKVYSSFIGNISRITFKTYAMRDSVKSVFLTKRGRQKQNLSKVNNEKLITDTNYAFGDSDADQIIVPKMSRGDKIEFITKNGSSIFTLVSDDFSPRFSKNVEFIPIQNPNSNTFQDLGNSTPGTENNGSDSTTATQTNITLTYTRGFQEDKIAFSPKEMLENFESLTRDNRLLESVKSKFYVTNNNYYLNQNTGIFEIKNIKNNQKFLFKFNNGSSVEFVFNEKTRTFTNITTENAQNTHLKVRLIGKFESAVLNQKKYDGISAATGSSTQIKNSSVKMQIAEVKKSSDIPIENEWKDAHNSGLRFGKDVKIIFDKNSGMKGIYNSLDSSVTLSGIPNIEGTFKIHAEVRDDSGREATSNKLTFKVFGPQTKLVDQIIEENFENLAHGGKKFWDMEPWAIVQFGGNDETVEIPSILKIIYGSRESGTYGELGYAISNEDNPHQKLIVGENDHLTLVNMKILSSVQIIVENGGKLNLYDSSMHGKVIVRNGGILQMNYDEHNKKFLTGAQINGQIILENGAIIEDSLIYSNTNFLANGNVARKNLDPLIQVNGNAEIRGKVYVRGDEAPTGNLANGEAFEGQPAISIKNATLNIVKDAELGAYAGGRISTTTNGGHAIKLDNGNITGEGKLISVAGTGFGGNGGHALKGTGTIDVKNVFLQGGDTYRENKNIGFAFEPTLKLNIENAIANNGNKLGILQDNHQPYYWKDITKSPDTSNTNLSNGKQISHNLDSQANQNENENPEKPSTQNQTPSKPNNTDDQSNNTNNQSNSTNENPNNIGGDSTHLNNSIKKGLIEINKNKLFIKDNFNKAENEWIKVENDWYFFDEDTKGVKGWKKIKEKWYFFDENSIMKTDWLKYKKQWYFLNRNGDMRTGWLKDKGKWYFLNQNGDMRTGWLKDKGKWYFLNQNGDMQTNIKIINNVTYKFDKNGALK